MEKDYIKNYFRIICDMPLRVLVKNTRDWSREIRNAKSEHFAAAREIVDKQTDASPEEIRAAIAELLNK